MIAALGPCEWPGCGAAGQVSGDGGDTSWCWLHVDDAQPVLSKDRMATCRRCGGGTVWRVDGEVLHPECRRPYELLRAAAALI